MYKNNEEKLLWFLERMEETYNYSKQFIEERIEKIDYPGFFGVKLNTLEGVPFIHIFIQEKNDSKIIDYINISGILGIHIITDGTVESTKIYSKKSKNASLDFIPDLESYKKKSSNNQFNFKQELLSEKVENIFFDIHSYIRDIDGLHMDEALDELCKMLFCKMLDEFMIQNGGPCKFHKDIYCTVEELAITIRRMYENINKLEFLKLENTSIFSSEIKLSSVAINKIVEILQGYNLQDSDIDIKGRAFQKVLSPTIRAGMGQYFTPLQIIDLSINIISPKSNELVLDPFCGSGNFISRSFDYIKLFEDIESKNIYGIEKSDRMMRISLTDLILRRKDTIQLNYNDSLLDFRNYEKIKSNMFDVILTNPPFGSILGEDAFTQLGKFDLAKGYKSVPLEIIGIERSIQFLRPGGRMAIVLPDGILTNKRMETVRKWIEHHMKIRAIISLPTETFSPFGANIKTSLLILRKWNVNEDKNEDYKVCMCQLNNIGYDAAGRIRKDNEIEEVQNSVLDFLNKEGW